MFSGPLPSSWAPLLCAPGMLHRRSLYNHFPLTESRTGVVATNALFSKSFSDFFTASIFAHISKSIKSAVRSSAFYANFSNPLIRRSLLFLNSPTIRNRCLVTLERGYACILHEWSRLAHRMWMKLQHFFFLFIQLLLGAQTYPRPPSGHRICFWESVNCYGPVLHPSIAPMLICFMS